MKVPRRFARLASTGRSGLRRIGYDVSRVNPVRYVATTGGGTDGPTATIRETEYRHFLHLRYVESRDPHGLVARMGEAAELGTPVFRFPDRPAISRDLLETANEVIHLDARIDLLHRADVGVLCVGAHGERRRARLAAVLPATSVVATEARRGTDAQARFDVVLADVRGSSSGALDVRAVVEIEPAHVFVRSAGGSFDSPPSTGDVAAEWDRRLTEAGYDLVDDGPAVEDEFSRALTGVADRFRLYQRGTTR